MACELPSDIPRGQRQRIEGLLVLPLHPCGPQLSSDVIADNIQHSTVSEDSDVVLEKNWNVESEGSLLVDEEVRIHISAARLEIGGFHT